jgi:hypothetical protein
MSDSVLNLTQAASYLDATETTVKRWAKERLIASSNSDVENPTFEEEVLRKYKEINERLKRL